MKRIFLLITALTCLIALKAQDETPNPDNGVDQNTFEPDLIFTDRTYPDHLDWLTKNPPYNIVPCRREVSKPFECPHVMEITDTNKWKIL